MSATASLEDMYSDSSCPGGYTGPSVELGGGFAEGSISISKEPMTSGGIGVGLGGKFTVCGTGFLLKPRIIGKCCEND